MKMNIVEFNQVFPNDLMTFQEVESKYKIKYATLYKYTKLLNEIPVYTRGGLKVSERDLIKWLSSGLEPAKG